MKIHYKIKDAEFNISDTLIIRYKKNYGFWILKCVDNNWQIYTNKFAMNPHGMGFKIQYGFSFPDMKEFLFPSFDEALKASTNCDSLPYWEYNEKTHIKFGDSIMKESQMIKVFNNIIKEVKANP